MTQLSPADLPAYVRANASKYGLDPAAVLAMAQHEGIGGNPGDGNTSFGPWQLHIGGALPSNIGALGPATAQRWAWSTDGIDYAMQAMSKNAKNLTGYAAVTALGEWERSADIPGQISRAWASYAGWLGSNIPITLSNVINVITGAGKKEQVPGEGDGQGNVIVPVPSIPGGITIPDNPTSPATGGSQAVKLGTIGPLDIGIPSGLVLGLLGAALLLLGAILFVYGGASRVGLGNVGAVARKPYGALAT